ncbi:MAG: FliA/WhiG family RNA polymerase sigma factor [Armatimonadetes bacterium]|nr:FliA/WhiG family RNA polymerase sigma factor [Armatimonadota bacterium]
MDLAQLWRATKDHDDHEARDLLIEHYLPLVKNIASGVIRKLRQGVEVDDLVSDGTFGLMRAIDAFDPARGVKFETYATPVVRGSIYNGLRTLDWVPERTRGKARALQKAMDKITQLTGRTATEAELAEELKMSAKEVYELINDLGTVYLLSLDQPLGSSEDDDMAIIDTVQDRGHDPCAEAEFSEARSTLREAINSLQEREQVLIRKHYLEGVNFETIARMMGVSKQRISQMHTRAVRRLREALGNVEIPYEAMHTFTMNEDEEEETASIWEG